MGGWKAPEGAGTEPQLGLEVSQGLLWGVLGAAVGWMPVGVGGPTGISGARGSPRKSWGCPGGQCQLSEGLSDLGLQPGASTDPPPAWDGGQRGRGAVGQDLWVQPHTW